MSPKTYLEKLYPDLAGAWPVEGPIETIISDSTTTLMNARVVNALGSLGINHETTKHDSSEPQAIVERAFLTILKGHTNLLAGGRQIDPEKWTHRVTHTDAYMPPHE